MVKTDRTTNATAGPSATRPIIPDGFVNLFREECDREAKEWGNPSLGMAGTSDDELREIVAELLAIDPYMQRKLEDYNAAADAARSGANTMTHREDARILKVRDYASRVPTGIDDAFRESILDTCLASAFLQTKGIDEAQRQATFVFTDPSLDSYKEIIDAGAFDDSLAQYMRNPVVLPEHRHQIEGEACPIVGHTVKIFKRGKALLGTIYFGTWPVGDYRWQAIVAGSLRAVSVGFRPVTTERDKDGVLHYTSALLREVSTVAVGANDNALLVNSYVAAKAAHELYRESDAGRAADLRALVRELQADIDRIHATLGMLKRGDGPNGGAGKPAGVDLSAALGNIDAAVASVNALRTGGKADKPDSPNGAGRRRTNRWHRARAR